MNQHKDRALHGLLALCLAVAMAACGGAPSPAPEVATRGPTAPIAGTPTAEPLTATATPPSQEPAVPTPTPTPTGEPLPISTQPPAATRCDGLAGELEIQVLVGPAEAVGLEPAAVGSVPFAVTASGSPYSVEGQGPISYEATLAQEWGTYTVTMDLEMAVQGECSGQAGSERLDLVLEMTGEQLVVVDAEHFHGEYPWAGTQSLDLTFPLEEGATAQGEGWVVALHPGSR